MTRNIERRDCHAEFISASNLEILKIVQSDNKEPENHFTATSFTLDLRMITAILNLMV
jgi:hypothetical protein